MPFDFFQDVCVDKARLEECEERASELSRKVSNFTSCNCKMDMGLLNRL